MLLHATQPLVRGDLMCVGVRSEPKYIRIRQALLDSANDERRYHLNVVCTGNLPASEVP